MYYTIIFACIVLYLLWWTLHINASVSKETFDNRDYVIPDESSAFSYQMPDVSWIEFEKNIQNQMDSDNVKETETTETTETSETTETESKSEYKTELEKETKVITETDSEKKTVLENSKSKSKSELHSDQIYIMQKQKSAPRYVPKFSNDVFNVYEPKEPKLRYATRPGPNSFHDILSQRAHVETEEERKRDWEAQKSAQERHEDLLRRTNWIFASATRVSPDRILKQPKMIPGPANEDKYSRRYSHFGLAA